MARKKATPKKQKLVYVTAEIEAYREFLKDMNSGKVQRLDAILFGYILSYAWGDDGICKQPMKKMAEEYGKSRITIEQALKRLHKAGYISKVYRVRKHDTTIVEVPSWKEAVKRRKDGNDIISTWFKVAKIGFRTHSK